jgi:hypothetical protein
MVIETVKKLIVIILILLLPSLFLFAGENWIDFSAGVGVSYEGNLISVMKGLEKFNKDSLDITLDLRNKILFAEADLAGELFITSQGELCFNGTLTAGFTDDLFSVARISLTAGPSFNYRNDGKKGTLIVEGATIENISLAYVFMNSPFTFRATLDFLLGPVLKIGAAYSLPTEYTLASGNLNQLVPNGENWRDGKFSLCFLITLI